MKNRQLVYDFLRTIYIPLWSYSNDDTVLNCQFIKNLHSTMVLFKLKFELPRSPQGKIYIPLWSYSNHFRSKPKFFIIFIYIPLWSYSNHQPKSRYLHAILIYIPLWSYSNIKQIIS